MAGAPGPFVSVLIPCWNAGTTIERAIASVLEGSDESTECVVVDDASTDDTVERVRAIAQRDPRVILVALETNQGVSNARNRGLELVRGEWLTLLDADDRFLPGGLARLRRAASASDALAVIGQQVWSDGRRTRVGRLYDIPDITRAGRTSLARRPGLLYFVSPHAKLLHRSCFEGLRFSGRVLGDQPWVIRALLRAGDRIDVLSDVVYDWYRPAPSHATSSITSRSRASADRGVEAAAVALQALAEVRTEAGQRLDEQDRAVLLTRYVERLLRSDLGVHLAGALRRGDPTVDQLIDAIRTFVLGVPPAELAGSNALARNILEPPIWYWHRVPRAGRAAYWRLLATALEADPDVVRRTRTPFSPLPLRLAWSSRARRPRAHADLVLALWGVVAVPSVTAAAIARGLLRR